VVNFATNVVGASENRASSQEVIPGITPAQHGSLQSLFPVNDMKSKKSFSPLKVGKGVRGGEIGVVVGAKFGTKVGVGDGIGRIGVTVGNRVTVG
jgi:hypothetical protein